MSWIATLVTLTLVARSLVILHIWATHLGKKLGESGNLMEFKWSWTAKKNDNRQSIVGSRCEPEKYCVMERLVANPCWRNWARLRPQTQKPRSTHPKSKIDKMRVFCSVLDFWIIIYSKHIPISELFLFSNLTRFFFVQYQTPRHDPRETAWVLFQKMPKSKLTLSECWFVWVNLIIFHQPLPWNKANNKIFLGRFCYLTNLFKRFKSDVTRSVIPKSLPTSCIQVDSIQYPFLASKGR